MEEIIEVKRAYLEELEAQSMWLICLEGAGVDNWEGYDFAIDMWDENYQEEYGDRP